MNGLNAEVFIWDEFHDRYLITESDGIKLTLRGFDTATNPNAKTTWCRLGQEDLDMISNKILWQFPRLSFIIKTPVLEIIGNKIINMKRRFPFQYSITTCLIRQ